MALAVGDEVALIRNPAADTLASRGDVLFGIVSAVASQSDLDVLWANGEYTQHIIAALLDKIFATSAAPIIPAVYTFSQSPAASSPEYQCLVERVYSRNPANAGSSVDFVQLRCLSTGQLFEALQTTVSPVAGR